MAFGVTSFPAALDDLLSLLPARDTAATQLTASLTTGATSMTVADTSRFPTAGVLTFKGEHIGYTGKTSTSFTGLTRANFTADGGLTAQSGAIGDPVRLAVTARHHNVLAEALIAVMTKLGIAASTPTAGTVLKGTGTGTSAWGALAKADVGLSNVDNTADTAKPVSTAQSSAISAAQAAAIAASQPLDADLTALASAPGNGLRVIVFAVAEGAGDTLSNSSTVTYASHISGSAVLPAGTWELTVLYTATFTCGTGNYYVDARVGLPNTGSVISFAALMNVRTTVMPYYQGSVVSDGSTAISFRGEYKRNAGAAPTPATSAATMIVLARRTA